jgi:hypothetical protein
MLVCWAQIAIAQNQREGMVIGECASSLRRLLNSAPSDKIVRGVMNRVREEVGPGEFAADF